MHMRLQSPIPCSEFMPSPFSLTHYHFNHSHEYSHDSSFGLVAGPVLGPDSPAPRAPLKEGPSRRPVDSTETQSKNNQKAQTANTTASSEDEEYVPSSIANPDNNSDKDRRPRRLIDVDDGASGSGWGGETLRPVVALRGGAD